MRLTVDLSLEVLNSLADDIAIARSHLQSAEPITDHRRHEAINRLLLAEATLAQIVESAR